MSMRWVSPIRALGVLAGVVLVSIGTEWLLSAYLDPPPQNVRDVVLFGLSLFVPGVLLLVPWSRLRNRALWYCLFVALVVAVPPGTALILAVNTWSAIHGAGAWGYSVAALLVAAWITQLPAIWTLRPRTTAAA